MKIDITATTAVSPSVELQQLRASARQRQPSVTGRPTHLATHVWNVTTVSRGGFFRLCRVTPSRGQKRRRRRSRLMPVPERDGFSRPVRRSVYASDIALRTTLYRREKQQLRRPFRMRRVRGRHLKAAPTTGLIDLRSGSLVVECVLSE